MTESASARILLILVTVVVSIVFKFIAAMIYMQSDNSGTGFSELFCPALENFLPLLTVFILHKGCLAKDFQRHSEFSDSEIRRSEENQTYREDVHEKLVDL